MEINPPKELICPNCKNDDETLIEKQPQNKQEQLLRITSYVCGVCSKLFRVRHG